MIVIGASIALFSSDIVDSLFEGEEHPWYVEAGRHEGAWRFEGNPKEQAEFAHALQRIEFRIDDPLPGSWKGKELPPGTPYLRIGILGRGTCLVDGREYAYRLLGRPDDYGNTWLQFDEEPSFLTERAQGKGFRISLEVKRKPENDWLYLWFGLNRDGSMTGFPYSRAPK